MNHALKYPPASTREHILACLRSAFDTEDFEFVEDAYEQLTDFYRLAKVRVTRRKRFKPRTVAGLCWEDGRIELLCPSVWKKEGRERDAWVAVALHELGHYVLWADAETKADAFAARMMG